MAPNAKRREIRPAAPDGSHEPVDDLEIETDSDEYEDAADRASHATIFVNPGSFSYVGPDE